jgi:hypothetical protein
MRRGTPKHWWIALCIVVLVMGLRCGSDRGSEPEPGPEGIEPQSPTIEVSSSQQFFLISEGETLSGTWYVNDVKGGTPGAGMITSDGFYIAPAELPAGGRVTLMVVPNAPLAAISNQITLSKTGETPWVSISPPDTTVVVADSLVLVTEVSGCTSDELSWSNMLFRGTSADVGTLRQNGTYVAPASPDGDFELMIKAASLACMDKTGIARVIVKKPVWFAVEAEDYSEAGAPDLESNVACGGGVGISGLDIAGEWIRIPVDIHAGGTYMLRVRGMTGTQDVLTLELTAEGCGPEADPDPSVTFVMNQGSGVAG